MIEEKVLKSFNGRNVLVTGGTGLIGRQVVDMLCNAGARVKIVSLDKIKVNEKAEQDNILRVADIFDGEIGGVEAVGFFDQIFETRQRG